MTCIFNCVTPTTAHDRFQEWGAAGVFLKLWQAGVERFDELQGIDWSWLSMDGAMNKAPLGGEKDRAEADGSRQARCQTQSLDGGTGSPNRYGGRGGEPPRYETGAGNSPEHSGRAAGTHGRTTAGPVLGQRR